MLGKIVFQGDKESSVKQVNPNLSNLVDQVSLKAPQLYKTHKEPLLNKAGERMRILAVDCGIKANIVRYFMINGVDLLVVPWDYEFTKEKYDGLFISNGPGDPTMCAPTIAQLKIALTQETPIFGICLGNQLLALAAGCKTYKMKYGNRGANQPCIDTRTNRCYITAQNDGMLNAPSLARSPCGRPRPPPGPARLLAAALDPRRAASARGCQKRPAGLLPDPAAHGHSGTTASPSTRTRCRRAGRSSSSTPTTAPTRASSTRPARSSPCSSTPRRARAPQRRQ